MYLFYESNCYWEIDYITKTLLKGVEYELKFFDTQEIRNIENFKNIENIENKKDIIGNNILVFGSNSEFPSNNDLKDYKIFKTVEYLKPKIIIHLSDEWGNKPALNLLSNYTSLLLRQYSHPNYPISDNILHIPLGYMHDMFEDNYENIVLKDASKREFKWSFIGNIKQDRQEMISVLSEFGPNIVKKSEPSEMRDIYRNSIFVPNGRGNRSLDCFRLYEATMCGAIPIIVSENDNEFKETFDILDNPPFIFCNSWKEALGVCKFLCMNFDLLDRVQKNIIIWWKIYLSKIWKNIKLLCIMV